MSVGPEIVREHGGLVWQTVYRLLGREEDASDAFQNVFVAAMEVAARQEVRHWPGLLRRIAPTVALDALRRRIRERGRLAGDGQDIVEGNAGALRDRLPEPGEVAEIKESVEELRRALGELPETVSEAFCLRHVSGMSYEEIGVEMGISVNSVGATLCRAKERLTKLMTKKTGETQREVTL